IRKEVDKIIPEREMKYERVFQSDNGYVDVHPTHKASAEYQDNLIIAKYLVEKKKESYKLLPINTEKGAVNPDAQKVKDRSVWEWKTNKTGTENGIKQRLRDASKQSNNILINVDGDISVELLARAIKGRVNQIPNLERLRVIY